MIRITVEIHALVKKKSDIKKDIDKRLKIGFQQAEIISTRFRRTGRKLNSMRQFFSIPESDWLKKFRSVKLSMLENGLKISQ